MKIYLCRNGENYGPFDVQQLQTKLENGELFEGDTLWYEGLSDWVPIEEFLTDLSDPGAIEPEIGAAKAPRITGLEPQKSGKTRNLAMLCMAIAILCIGGNIGFQASFSKQKAQQATHQSSKLPAKPLATPESANSLESPTPASEPQESLAQTPLDSTPKKSARKISKASRPKAKQLNTQASIEQTLIVATEPNLQDPTPVAPKESGDPKEIAASGQNATKHSAAAPATLADAFEIITIAPPQANGQPLVPATQLFICNKVENPRGILVLCADLVAASTVDRLTTGQEWQEYCRENDLGLVVMVFRERKSTGGRPAPGYPADSPTGKWLINTINYHFGTDVPLLVYGTGRGGTFTSSLINWQPDRIIAWGGYTNRWGDGPVESKSSPPGIIAYDIEDPKAGLPGGGARYFRDARTLKKPVLEVKHAIPFSRRQKELDPFVRDYFKAVLSGESKKDAKWISLRTRTESVLDSMSNPLSVVWLPSSRFIGPWAKMVEPPKLSESDFPAIIERTIATNNAKQPSLTLFLRLPAGKSGDQIDGLLAFCSWEGKQEEILKKLKLPDYEKNPKEAGAALKDIVYQLIDFADKNNLGILTWETKQAWSLKPSYDDRHIEENREADFESLANAWEEGLKRLHAENGIPTKDFLLYGISRGAQWAHRLALRKPELFLAVHFHVSSTFDTPVPDASRVLWLVSTGDREVGFRNGDALRFYRQCQKLEYPVLFKVGKNLGHDNNSSIDIIRNAFFRYALSLRQEVLLNGGESAAALALEQINSASWIGDFTTHKALPVAIADGIPEGNKVQLPTEILARAWEGKGTR